MKFSIKDFFTFCAVKFACWKKFLLKCMIVNKLIITLMTRI